MTKSEKDLDTFTLVSADSGGKSGLVATALVAAAVGAGVALLFTTDGGNQTRKRLSKRLRKLELGRRFEGLEIGKRADSLRSDAADELKRLRKKGMRRLEEARGGGGGGMHKPMLALLGTLAGAAAAVLLAPDSGTETRERIGRKLGEIKTDASTRWEEHRAARAKRNEARASNGRNDNGASDAERAAGVRSVQELGREGEEVF